MTDNIPSPTKHEEKEWLDELHANFPQAALFNVHSDYQQLSSTDDHTLPLNLTSIYRETFRTSSYDDSISACEYIDLGVTIEQQQRLEQLTKLQQGSQLWFDFRSGRVSASVFYDVCHTTISKPSKSLLMKICYPLKCKFSSPQTDWGLKKEKIAFRKYVNTAKYNHVDFIANSSGFVISVDNPRFGATPDGVIQCSCCGKGVLEIKCPYSLKDSSCIQTDFLDQSGDVIRLKEGHRYYYQVQLQMFVIGVKYCDFVVWSPHDILVVRVMYNASFCLDKIDITSSFNEKCVLPELLGKYFSVGIDQMPNFTDCENVDMFGNVLVAEEVVVSIVPKTTNVSSSSN